jgi:hypothetical protein
MGVIIATYQDGSVYQAREKAFVAHIREFHRRPAGACEQIGPGRKLYWAKVDGVISTFFGSVAK